MRIGLRALLVTRSFVGGMVTVAVTTSALLGNPVQITFSGTDSSPAWSPTGSEIVFSSARPGSNGFDLWRIPASGGEATQLTDDISNEYAASWSPDGLTIAYYWAWEGTIYTIPASGGNPSPILSDPTADEDPTWSPHGNAIVYSSGHSLKAGERGFNHNIWVQPFPKGDAFALTSHTADDTDPTWSPDGKTIAFISDRDGSLALWKIPAEGGAATKLADGPALTPAWSPDGKWIAYSSEYDIFIVPSSGGIPIPVTDGPELDLYPSWSPSSSEIVFHRRLGDNFNLWILSLDPTAIEKESWGGIKAKFRDSAK